MRLGALMLCSVMAAACSAGSSPTTTADAQTTSTSPTTAATTTTGPTPTTLAPLQGLAVETVVEGLSNPLLVLSPLDDPRLFVVEKSGRIRIVADGVLREAPFLDISALVRDAGEQGFLGMAFHPAYAENGRFFVHYSDLEGDTRLVEYRVSEDPDLADSESARELLFVDQPAANHNGGMVTFGADDYLYLGLGDGGGAADTFGNGQRTDTLLAKLLRLDVDAGDPYAIPPDNPFAEGGGAPEAWAYGLRNPWRFAFDEGNLYIGDVGQNAWEEVDVASAGEAGLNYGWPIMEGLHCFAEDPCESSGLVQPVLEYPNPAEGCSVIGGFVYRGSAIPELAGHYFYGDLCSSFVRSFRYQDGEALDQMDWTQDLGDLGPVLSFGTDARGELYVTSASGIVFRIVGLR